MTFADRLIQLRKENKMTQAELADHLGISRSSESMYEKSGRRPSFELLDSMAEFFDVDVSYLLGSSDERRPYKEQQDPDDSLLHLSTILRPDEFALITAFRSSSYDVRQTILRALGVK